MATKDRTYYLANREKILAKSQAWRDAHPGSSGRPTKDRTYYLANREKILAKSRAWRDAHPRSGRDRHLKEKYGLTELDYNLLLDKQDGRCALCRTDKPGRNRYGDRFVVDHDHATGRVRGLLCHRCNKALPAAEEPNWLLRVGFYLDGS